MTDLPRRGAPVRADPFAAFPWLWAVLSAPAYFLAQGLPTTAAIAFAANGAIATALAMTLVLAEGSGRRVSVPRRTS
ncbi:MAG: hypothetical protein AAF390_05830 [Pseudomonadota bacterium]